MINRVLWDSFRQQPGSELFDVSSAMEVLQLEDSLAVGRAHTGWPPTLL